MPSTTSTLAFVTAVLAVTAAPTKPKEDIKYFVTFGDSYSQTGFNASSGLPSTANPFGNPAYPGWTSSGGANWIGYLGVKYNKTLTYVYNFAYGGATVDAELVKPYAPTVLSLIDQVGLFNASIASKPAAAKWTSSDSLFGIWIGVNDVGNSWWLEDQPKRITAIHDRLFQQIDVLYAAGARNFAFLNVPPINKTPAVIAQGEAVQTQEATVIALWNGLLANRTSSLVKSKRDIKAVVVDTQKPFNTAIADPQKYGAANATCYGATTECLWFNDYHPGTAIQELVAKAVAKAWSKFFKS